MNATSTLSLRGQTLTSQLTIPWRYVDAGPLGRYDPISNPHGVLTQLTSAENGLVQDLLADFVNDHNRLSPIVNSDSNSSSSTAGFVEITTRSSILENHSDKSSTGVQFPPEAFGYKYSTAGGPKLPGGLARHLNRFWKPVEEIKEGDVKIIGAATALHEVLGFAIGDVGEGILTSRPYYGRFELDFGLKAGLKIVAADTAMDTCFEPSVVEAFEAALQKANAEGVRIKALLITNPHNPLGRCYPPATLIALQQFCQKHKIHFISDEIYALSVFDSKESGAHPFTSVFSVEQHIDPDRLHVIYGFSKDYGAPGLRLGALITRSEALRNAFTAMIRFHNPSGASVAIATAMLQDTDWMDGFLATSRKRVEEAYMFITKRLGEMGVRYAEGTNAGLFVFVDLSPWLIEDRGQGQEAREQELARRAFDKGLGLQPGEEHAREVGWFRLVYTLDRGIVDEGLRRLEIVLKG